MISTCILVKKNIIANRGSSFFASVFLFSAVSGGNKYTDRNFHRFLGRQQAGKVLFQCLRNLNCCMAGSSTKAKYRVQSSVLHIHSIISLHFAHFSYLVNQRSPNGGNYANSPVNVNVITTTLRKLQSRSEGNQICIK